MEFSLVLVYIYIYIYSAPCTSHKTEFAVYLVSVVHCAVRQARHLVATDPINRHAVPFKPSKLWLYSRLVILLHDFPQSSVPKLMVGL
jgi:hypothetical protein